MSTSGAGAVEVTTDVMVRLLGSVELWRDRRWLRPRTPQQRLVLGMLGLRITQVVSVDHLVEVIWDDRPPRSARNSIQVLITRVRELVAGLPGVELRRCGDGYRLTGDPDSVDLHRFRRLLGQARSTPDSGTAITLLDEALGLWRGSPFADAADSPLVHQIRAGLANERLGAAEDRASVWLRRGRHREAAGELSGLLAEHPLRERLAELLMTALYRCGRRSDALQVFHDIRAHLADELGLAPTPALGRLYERILHDDPILTAADDRHDPASEVERPAAPVVPRQLPPVVPHFTGRTEQLRTLSRLLDRTGETPGGVVIAVIDGTAGIGKTTLAVRWAHEVADHFPDGQLYVNLRGFDPSGTPVTPAEAIRGFLTALGIAPTQTPSDVDDQISLYRSALSGKRMLIILDNAHDPGQVRALLPGSSQCLVVVTSRTQLASLVAVEGAKPLTLDFLTDAESRDLLARQLGVARVESEPAAVAELIARCAHLPLALSIAAARAARRPGLPLADLATELNDVHGRLAVLNAGDERADMRTVFSWSCRHLTPTAGRMFLALGLHSGPDITSAAAASLTGIDVSQARDTLRELTEANLITERVRDRFASHDLLRAYAAGQARVANHDLGPAVDRALDHYLYTAHAAAQLLHTTREPLQLPTIHSGVSPEKLTCYQHAWDWFDAEYPVLLASVALAAGTGLHRHAWQLPCSLADFLDLRAHWRDWAALQRTALASAQRLADRNGEARARCDLGYANVRLASYPEADAQLRRALDLHRRLGDHAGQARAHHALDQMYAAQGNYRQALYHAGQMLTHYRAASNQLGHARALNAVGWYHTLLGDHVPALGYCEQALGLLRDLGDRAGEADTLDSLGHAQHHLGQHAQAIAYYQNALELYRELGVARSQADTLARLGDTHRTLGDQRAAADAWRRALAVLDDPAHPDTAQLHAKLHGLASA